MPVPSSVTDLTSVAASNSPAGGEAVFPELDNYLRAYASFIKQNYDSLTGKANSSAAAFTGTATFSAIAVAETASFSALIAGSAGARFGNTAVATTNVLDWYEEGTFTPTVSFGGASVGVTYTTQQGRFTRTGNRVDFTIYVILSAKGSSTGTAAVGTLPYTHVSNAPTFCGVYANTLSGLTGAAHGVVDGGTSVTLYQTTSTGSAVITDARFANTTTIAVSGSYQV